MFINFKRLRAAGWDVTETVDGVHISGKEPMPLFRETVERLRDEYGLTQREAEIVTEDLVDNVQERQILRDMR